MKSRKLIQLLFRSGKSFTVFPYRVYYLPLNLSGTKAPAQAAFSVSSRSFKKAVHRNRIKRLTREVWRLQKHEVYTYLKEEKRQVILFFLYIGRDMPEYAMVAERFSLILTKLRENLADHSSRKKPSSF